MCVGWGVVVEGVKVSLGGLKTEDLGVWRVYVCVRWGVVAKILVILLAQVIHFVSWFNPLSLRVRVLVRSMGESSSGYLTPKQAIHPSVERVCVGFKAK